MSPAYMDWRWDAAIEGFRDYVVEFTIHNDVGDWSDRHTLNLILMQNSISGAQIYVALNTDVDGRGKGLLFSRWGTGNVNNARHSLAGGWTDSSGDDFIGVRRLYDWAAGDFRLRIGPDGLDSDGEWFSAWITDLDTDKATWIGSLKFPLLDGTAKMQPRSATTIQMHGFDQIRPIDIPQWHVSLGRPSGDSVFAVKGFTTYPFDGHENALPNSDVRYDESEDRTHLIVGGTTERRSPARHFAFKTLADREPIPIPSPTISSSPTPSPTPTATLTPRPTLPAIQPDIADILAAKNRSLDQSLAQSLDELRKSMPKIAAKIRNMRWIRDGIGSEDAWAAEYWAAKALIDLAAAGHADSLVDQQWVIRGENYGALGSLLELFNTRTEMFDRIMSDPNISDGISDKEAKIVATLSRVADPDVIDKLLDPSQVTLEERIVSLTLAGETEFAIVRTREGAGETMDSLGSSVRIIEEFMGLPLPQKQVIYRFEEILSGRGLNHFSHVTIGYDELAHSTESMLTLLAHEAGHYYWRGREEVWMNEGPAMFLSSVANRTLQGPVFEAPCSLARSITEFEESAPDVTQWDAYVCPYSLGERLFRDLYRHMDDTTFRLGFRRLFLTRLVDSCGTANDNICYIREAFTTHAPEETVPAIEEVIARWHSGNQPYDASWIDDSPVNSKVSAIDGQVENAYLSLVLGGPAVSEVPIDPAQDPVIYLNLEYSYGSAASRESLPIEVRVSFEDGFEFRRVHANLPAPANDTPQAYSIGIRHAKALGSYWVQVYSGKQKFAELTYKNVIRSDN